MIEHGDQFLASMTKLTKISEHIFSNRGAMSSARINLSNGVTGLTKEEVKQFRVFQNFINTEQKYLYPPATDNPTVVSYTAHHIQEFETLTSEPIYIDNAIIVTRD